MSGKGYRKSMLNIIRLLENGLAAWWQDFSGVETPLLIKYVKTDKARKSLKFVDDEKKATKRDDTVFLLFPLGSILKIQILCRLIS